MCVWAWLKLVKIISNIHINYSPMWMHTCTRTCKYFTKHVLPHCFHVKELIINDLALMSTRWSKSCRGSAHDAWILDILSFTSPLAYNESYIFLEIQKYTMYKLSIRRSQKWLVSVTIWQRKYSLPKLQSVVHFPCCSLAWIFAISVKKLIGVLHKLHWSEDRASIFLK